MPHGWQARAKAAAEAEAKARREAELAEEKRRQAQADAEREKQRQANAARNRLNKQAGMRICACGCSVGAFTGLTLLSRVAALGSGPIHRRRVHLAEIGQLRSAIGCPSQPRHNLCCVADCGDCAASCCIACCAARESCRAWSACHVGPGRTASGCVALYVSYGLEAAPANTTTRCVWYVAACGSS